MTLHEPAIEEAAPVSFAEKAYQLLVRKITRLELAPGAVLVEKNLMTELGIGRTPIREALQRLAAEGLVLARCNAATVRLEWTSAGGKGPDGSDCCP